MKLIKLNCQSCGSPMSVPDDLEMLYCSACGSQFMVEHGEGYIALKLIEQVTKAIHENGDKAHSAILNNTFVTKVELKKVQISQSISTEEMKLNSIRQEIRQLCRNPLLTPIEEAQITSLRLDECNSALKIRKLNLDSARLDPGWEESMAVFQSDLIALEGIIGMLSPYIQDVRIASRVEELKLEQHQCQENLNKLETSLTLRSLKSQKYAPIAVLALEELEKLKTDLQMDLETLDNGPDSPIRSQIRTGVKGLQDQFNSLYPRKKLESQTGKLASLDLHPPYPEVPRQLTPFIDLAERDLVKVEQLEESPERAVIQEQIEKLVLFLKRQRALDIPAMRIRQAEWNRKRDRVLLIIGGGFVLLCILLLILFNG